MSAEKLYSEVFEEFEKAETKADRIAVLRKYDHPRFRDFLSCALNSKIEFDVEVPKYRPAEEPAGLNFTYLDIEMTKIYRFIKGHPKRPPGLTPQKQKQLLLVILEALHKDEAEIMVQLVQKKIKVNHLTIKLVQEAYGI
jgi:hypothetical protein